MKQYMIRIDVWIKYGNCCKYLNEIENAINAYRNAVKLDSSNCEAALLLVDLLKKNILFDEASSVIKTSMILIFLDYYNHNPFCFINLLFQALNHEKSKTLTNEVEILH